MLYNPKMESICPTGYPGLALMIHWLLSGDTVISRIGV